MAKFQIEQTDFSGGEISPRALGRFGVEEYSKAVETMRECFPTKFGTARRRGGTQFGDNTKSDAQAVFIPWKQDTDVQLVLEFTNLKMRIWRHNSSTNVPELAGAPTEVTTLFATAELENLRYAQFGATMYLCSGSRAMYQLIRESDTSWDLRAADFNVEPFELDFVEDVKGTTFTLSATSGSAVTITSTNAIFRNADVGRHFYEDTSDPDGGYGVITGYTDATHLTMRVLKTFSTTNVAGIGDFVFSPVTTLTPSGFKEGEEISLTGAAAWTKNSAGVINYVGDSISINNGLVEITAISSTTVALGVVKKALSSTTATSNWFFVNDLTATYSWPKLPFFYEQRFGLANFGTDESQAKLSISLIVEFLTHYSGTNDNDGLGLDLATNIQGDIKWVHSDTEIIVGTSEGEITISGGRDSALTPTSPYIKNRSSIGSISHIPATAEDFLIFIDKTGNRLMSYQYAESTNKYKPVELSQQAEHLLEDAEQVVYAPSLQTLFVRRDDGKVVSCVFIPDLGVVGFSLLNFNGVVESMAVISDRNKKDRLWMSVKRTIDGGTERHVEVYDPDKYLDGYITYSGSSTTSITGLDHWEGEEVHAINGTNYLGSYTVSSGAITLTKATTDCIVGKTYTMTLKTLRPKINVGQGTMQNKPQRWVEPILRIYESMPPLVNGKFVPNQNSGNAIGSPPLITGDLEYEGGTEWADTGQLEITQSLPYPCEILAIFGSFEANNDG